MNKTEYLNKICSECKSSGLCNKRAFKAPASYACPNILGVAANAWDAASETAQLYKQQAEYYKEKYEAQVRVSESLLKNSGVSPYIAQAANLKEKADKYDKIREIYEKTMETKKCVDDFQERLQNLFGK